MRTFSRKVLVANVAFMTAIAAVPNAMSAGIPVFDGANMSQTTISAIEAVAHTLKQIQQYQTQLQQYENQLQNTMAPAAFIWDDAVATMDQLRESIDTLNHFKAVLGGIDAYLGNFKDTAAYRNSPCYSPDRACTPGEWAAMNESQVLGSEAQQSATSALFKGLDKQQDSMQSDAAQLRRLQAAAQGAEGQMQAIGYANQLASQQANQLLQIRGLLMAQQNVIATRQKVQADREAREQAASEAHYRVPSTVSPRSSREF
jgi:P-type conjugative transfer protein TrbJ